MQPSKSLRSNVGIALLAGLSVTLLLPSCAFKRFSDWDEKETTAASAESLEDALAILDQAIEETAPASEINSIPLNVPAQPKDLENFIETPPMVTSISESELDSMTTETLFAIEEDSTEEAAAWDVDQGQPETEEESPEIIPDVEEKTREKIVVNRPAPNYRTDTETTAVFDEFRLVRTTAYSHTEADHIKYGELSAMGKPLRFGMVRSAAADWSRYPVGTRFRIVGKPYEYVVDDYGSALVGTDTIDLYKPSSDHMDDWGARKVEIEIIAWGSFGKSVEILEPRRKYGEHVAEMLDKIEGRSGTGDVLATAVDDASIKSHE